MAAFCVCGLKPAILLSANPGHSTVLGRVAAAASACSTLMKLVDPILEREAIEFFPFPSLERVRQRQQSTT